MKRAVVQWAALASLALLWLGACEAAEPPGQPIEVYARGDYAGVVALLEPDFKAGKAKIQERLLLARAYLHLNRQPDALAVLRNVLESDKENPEANSLTGRVLREQGKHKDAIPFLEHAYRLKPEPATAAALGQCHHALGQNTKAKAYLEKALEEDIRNPATSLVLGRICLDRGLGALAEKYLLMAQEAGMDTPDLHLLLGRAYLLERKLVGPIRVRRITGKVQPGQVVDAHVVLGKLDGVADTYKVCTRFSALYEGLHLLAAKPDEPEALYMAATGWLAAGDADRARIRLAALAKKEPASPRVATLLAEILLASRNIAGLEKAVAAAHAEKLLDARAAAAFYYRAAIDRRAAGQRDHATRLLKMGEKLTPTSAEILHSLAGLAAAMGHTQEASQYYARMVELFPDAADADEWRNAVKVLAQKGGQE